MNPIHASRDPGRFAVDYGHQVEEAHCPDEAELREQQILTGIRRAENERHHAAVQANREAGEKLPSEIFYG